MPLCCGLAWLLSAFEILQDRLVIHRVGRRRAINLGQLASAEIVVTAAKGGSQIFTLRLRDQRGTTATLRPGSYPAAKRRLALAALAPNVMAPPVQRTGQIEAALAGNLWRH